jgi:hypothetical protein
MDKTLYYCYSEFCKIKQLNRGLTLDLRKLDWVYPTTLLPLSTLIKKNKNVIKPVKKQVRTYIELMLSGESPSHKSYSKIVISKNFDKLTKNIFDIIEVEAKPENINESKDAFMEIISEITTNIEEHSQTRYDSYFMAQAYKKKGFIEFAFLDLGQGIPNSLRSSIKEKEKDYSYIKKATEGYSAKPEDLNRGNGLKDSIRLVCNGFKGEIFIASYCGAVYIDKNKNYSVFELDSYQKLDGTLISIRLPLPINKVDYTEYL